MFTLNRRYKYYVTRYQTYNWPYVTSAREIGTSHQISLKEVIDLRLRKVKYGTNRAGCSVRPKLISQCLVAAEGSLLSLGDLWGLGICCVQNEGRNPC